MSSESCDVRHAEPLTRGEAGPATCPPNNQRPPLVFWITLPPTSIVFYALVFKSDEKQASNTKPNQTKSLKTKLNV